jgi:hypothetical protein
MGEVFFKRLILLFLFICSAFLIIGIVNNSRNHDVIISDDFSADEQAENFITGDVVSDNFITGFVAHPIYSGFSAPESGFAFNNNTRTLSVTDTAVYKTGYYSINGSQWTSFTLSGTVYGTSPVWLTGTAIKALPSFGVGEHYIIIYSCKYNIASASWNCSDNRWQLLVINNTPVTVPPTATCSDGIQNQGETSVDCGGPCNECSSDVGICLNAGYNCGQRTISGSNRNCGACPSGSGLTCTNNLCISATGKTLYVATNGSDNNNGDINHPLATINKAWNMISAGDVIYVGGGTYTYDMMHETLLSDRSGQAGKMINIWNYPGEKPIIDFSANTFTSQVMGFRLQNANYIYLKGIRVTSINQPHQGGIAQYGVILWDHVSNCIFEQMETDHIGGWGTVIGDASNNNLFLNCDSHHNSDRYSTNGEPWGWSDGFQSNSWDANYQGQTSTGNIFRGCRSYWNSDDGWDLRRAQGIWTLENCWSFWNGYQPGEKLGDSDLKIIGGNGEGMKISGNFGAGSNDIRRTVVNSLSFENGAAGFGLWSDKPEGNPVGIHIYNSVAYKNIVGWGCSDEEGVSTTAFKNDISFANTNGNYWPYPGPIWFVHDHNSWDIPTTVTNADFLSLDSSCMDNARKADGSLPDCDFLHLAAGSKLIDNGTNVGLPYNGNAPDIGAFER